MGRFNLIQVLYCKQLNKQYKGGVEYELCGSIRRKVER